MKVMALCDSGSRLFGQHGERIILDLPGSASTPAAPGKDAAADRAALHRHGTQLASALDFSTLNPGGREQPLSPTRPNTQPVSLDLPLPDSSSSRHGNGSSFSSSSHSLPGEDNSS